MQAIRVLENCSTARRGFKRGEVVALGDALSETEALDLIKWRRAEQAALPVVETPVAETRSRRKAVTASHD